MTKNSLFAEPHFQNDEAARVMLESILWPDGPICPHCGNSDQEKITKGQGKVARPGLFYCAACNGQFTATVGTVFERSKIPLTKWWLANPRNDHASDGHVTTTNNPENMPCHAPAGIRGSITPRSHAVASPVNSISSAQPKQRLIMTPATWRVDAAAVASAGTTSA